jgi:hypothetical protein
MDPVTAGSDPSGEPKTASLHIAPPSDQHQHAGGLPPDPSGPTSEQSVVPPAIASGRSDACPNCGAQMALDQRYCLNCGNRRGDPRLPFMDAVVFMEASRQPKGGASAPAAPPPPPAKSRFSPSTTLIAGIATLILAVGVGVLIGQSGNNDSTPVANQQPTVIRVGGGEGGGEVEEAGTTPETNSGAKEANKGGKSKGGAKKGNKDAAVEEGSSGGSKAAQEVLHTAPGVKEAKPEVSVGEKCEKGTAGCSESGEFNGSFFGE